jgi:uncharacterized protein DUF6338
MLDFLKTPENLYLLLFIVPGLVIVYVRSRFISGRTPSHTENVLGYLVLSLLYYSIILPFIEQALVVREPWIARAAVWIVLTLVGPALFGLLLGIWAQNKRSVGFGLPQRSFWPVLRRWNWKE